MFPPEVIWALEPSILDMIDRGLYQDAITLIHSFPHEKNPQLYLAEATCYFNLKRYFYALDAIKLAEKRGWGLPEILILKGKCLYCVKEWESALAAFEKADEIRSSYTTKQWITRCKAHICVESDVDNDHVFNFEPRVIADVRKEMYQTQSHVSIALYVRDVSENELKVEFTSKTVDIKINQKKPISIHLKLFKEIIPDQSTYSITPSKIELKLKKLKPGVNWTECEEC